MDTQNQNGPDRPLAGYSRLLPEHAQYLADRGVPPEIANARGYQSLRAGKARRQPETEFGGLLYSNPMRLGADGGLGIPLHPLTQPDADAWQIRIPDEAVTDKRPKFRTPQGQRNVLATHPATRDGLLNPDAGHIIIAEGVTRVDALAAVGIPAAGITGCWSWRNWETALPDLDALPLKREILLAFDGDVTAKLNIYTAMRRLSGYLESKGATIRILVLPNNQGLDDFLAEQQPADTATAWKMLAQHTTRPGNVHKPDGAELPKIAPGSDYGQMLDVMVGSLMKHHSTMSDTDRWYRQGTPETGYYLARAAGITSTPVSVNESREACARFARWGFWKQIGENWKFVGRKPDEAVVRHIIETANPAWPILERISALPELTANGFETESGYDGESHTLRVIPNGITGEMLLQDTIAELNGVFGEFPFADDAGFANLLGMMLTPFVGTYTERGPGLMIDAPTPGTGKSLMADCAAIIISGKAPAGIQMSGKQHRGEETPKRLAAALSMSNCLRLDNLANDVDDPNLAEFLTGEHWTTRELGTNQRQLVFDCRTIATLATANNASLSRELADRFLNVRLDAQTENPREGRTFAIDNLIEHTKSRRQQLVDALASIVRAWHDAGRPQAKARPAVLGSFDHWRNVVTDILDHAGIGEFAGNMQSFTQRAAASDDYGAFIEAWWNNRGGMVSGVSELLAAAGLDSEESEPLIHVQTRSNSQRALTTALGTAIKRLRDRTFTLSDGTAVRVVECVTYRRAAQYRLEPAGTPEPGWNDGE